MLEAVGSLNQFQAEITLYQSQKCPQVVDYFLPLQKSNVVKASPLHRCRALFARTSFIFQSPKAEVHKSRDET